MGVGGVARMRAGESGCHERSHVRIHNLSQIEAFIYFLLSLYFFTISKSLYYTGEILLEIYFIVAGN